MSQYNQLPERFVGPYELDLASQIVQNNTNVAVGRFSFALCTGTAFKECTVKLLSVLFESCCVNTANNYD
jgi:hypothetical protein